MKDSTRNLILKIRELAKRGIGGEKINAEQKLREILEKYDLKESDLDDIHREDRYFYGVPASMRNLWAHIVWSVVPRAAIYDVSRRGKKVRGAHAVACSASEFVEIKAFYPMYVKAYKKELEIFRKAFILKNRLGVDGPKTGPKMTFEEAVKLSNLMNGIDTVPRAKALLNR